MNENETVEKKRNINYSHMQVYFPAGERQKIEKKIKRKLKSRDLVDAYKKSIGI